MPYYFIAPRLPLSSEQRTPPGVAMQVITLMWGSDIPNAQSRAFGYVPLMRGEQPTDLEDARQGGRCDRSGIWFPGHALVRTKGRRTGAPFYRPDPKDR